MCPVNAWNICIRRNRVFGRQTIFPIDILYLKPSLPIILSLLLLLVDVTANLAGVGTGDVGVLDSRSSCLRVDLGFTPPVLG